MGAVSSWQDERERTLVVITRQEFDLRHFTNEAMDFRSLTAEGRKVAQADAPA